LNENQDDSIRVKARLCKYDICYQHIDDDKDWDDFLEDGDKEQLALLKLALNVTSEPDDLNRLLSFKTVKEDFEHSTCALDLNIHPLVL
jgi:hypothetical protein